MQLKEETSRKIVEIRADNHEIDARYKREKEIMRRALNRMINIDLFMAFRKWSKRNEAASEYIKFQKRLVADNRARTAEGASRKLQVKHALGDSKETRD